MKFTIPKGKHTVWNLRRILTRLKPKLARKRLSLEFEAVINTEPYDIRPDADQFDKHKLIGFSLKWFTLANNENAALVSFQPDPIDKMWNIAPYVNHDYKWTIGLDYPVKAGEKFYGKIKLVEKNKVRIEVWTDRGESLPFEYTWKFTPKFLATLLPWHGGKDNDGNGIGGVAPIDINLNLKYKWKR